jgi:hypothetical protein
MIYKAPSSIIDRGNSPESPPRSAATAEAAIGPSATCGHTPIASS